MKFVDAKCPNCGGSVKLSPEGKSGKCENCGAELQIETEVADRLSRAFDLIFQQKFLAAEKLLNETLTLDSKNGQAYLGLLLCDLSLRSPELLAHAKVDYSNYPNFIRAYQFLDNQMKNELQQCCILNKDNLISLKANQNRFTSPTPLMEAFEKYNTFESNGQSFTIVSAIPNINFDEMSDEQIIRFYGNIAERMHKLIDINSRLSAEEKMHMKFYDSEQTGEAINIFLSIENVLRENGMLSENDEE